MSSFRPEVRYSDKVDNYAAYRPSYPRQVVASLAELAELPSGSVVAELGSGTGIFTHLLLGAGWSVLAVEPNREMRMRCERALSGRPGFTSVAASAEFTTLRSGSCDAVVAAQAFHWFDAERTIAEIHRILVPGGRVAITWNELSRSIDDFHRELYGVIKRCPDYIAYDLQRFECFSENVRQLFHGWHVQQLCFPQEQSLDLSGLRGRLVSNSYWPSSGSVASTILAEAVDELFAAHQVAGKVALAYDTLLMVMRQQTCDPTQPPTTV